MQRSGAKTEAETCKPRITTRRYCSILAMLVLAVSSGGCTTVLKRTPKSEIIETREVPGSSRIVLYEPVIVAQPKAFDELFLLRGRMAHEWQTQRVKRKSEEVVQLNYHAFIGQPGYDLLMDIIVEPLGAVLTPLLAPAITNWSQVGRVLLTAPIPGVAVMESPRESVRINSLGDTPMPPLLKNEPTNCSVRVQLLDEKRKILKDNEVLCGNGFQFNLCKYILDRGADACLTARIASEDIDVEGKSEFQFRYSLGDIVERQLAADANPNNYTPPELVWEGKGGYTEEGNGDGVLEAGEIVVLSCRIRNRAGGAALGLEAIARSADNSNAVLGRLPIRTLLRSGEASDLKLSLILPFARDDGVQHVDMVARDRLGRQSTSLIYDIPYVKTVAIPNLQVTGARLIRIDASKVMVRVQVRNRGKRAADDVVVRLKDQPSIGKVATDRVLIKSIDAFTEANADFELQINEAPPGDVELTVAADERMGIAGTERKLTLPLVLAEPMLVP